MTISDDFERSGPLHAAEQEFDPRHYLNILRRRWPFLIVPAVVVFAAFFWYARILPPVYQARATILVESQQIPTDLARPTVSANAAERIQLIEQRLIARDNLLEVARKYGLYAKEGLSPSDIVDKIRRSTSINQIDIGNVANRAQANTQAIGFTVSFSYDNPDVAARVANEYVTSILQQNIQSRTNRADETSKFFETQVAGFEHDLAAQEARIVAFKNQNQDALPETLTSRQSMFAQLQGQMSDIDGRVAILQTQKEMWQSRGDNALDPAAANSTDAQLNALRMQLAQLRAVDSDNHPDVKAAIAKIAALEKAAAAPPPATDAKTPAQAAGSSPNDLRIADIDAQIEQLKTQRAELEKRSANLDASIQKTPQIEIALNVLMRDYNGLQKQYSDAKANLAAAATGQQLEQDRQGERFEVVEQASVPSAPISPNRKRIMFTGAFGGVALGVGLMMLLEMLDRSIRDAGDLERRLRIRPLSAIPYVAVAGETRQRRRLLAAVAASGMAVVVLALVMIQLFYMPLDLVVIKVMGRLGI